MQLWRRIKSKLPFLITWSSSIILKLVYLISSELLHKSIVIFSFTYTKGGFQSFWKITILKFLQQHFLSTHLYLTLYQETLIYNQFVCKPPFFLFRSLYHSQFGLCSISFRLFFYNYLVCFVPFAIQFYVSGNFCRFWSRTHYKTDLVWFVSQEYFTMIFWSEVV